MHSNDMSMEATKLTPLQVDLLRMLSFDHSDEFAKEFRMVYNKFLQEKIEKESDYLWDAGILNADTIERLRTEDLHKPNY